jgi:hypothetical protein
METEVGARVQVSGNKGSKWIVPGVMVEEKSEEYMVPFPYIHLVSGATNQDKHLIQTCT